MARRRRQGEVELNVTAMLDMAFQLLAFFILTFKPAPVEGDVVLRMPRAAPTTQVQKAQSAGADKKNTNPVQGLTSLIITVMGNDTGGIQAMAIGDSQVGGLEEFATRLPTVLKDEGSGFDQVLIQVDSRLDYEGLMQVVDICTRQQLANGKKLTKLSFVELPTGG